MSKCTNDELWSTLLGEVFFILPLLFRSLFTAVFTVVFLAVKENTTVKTAVKRLRKKKRQDKKTSASKVVLEPCGSQGVTYPCD